MKRIRRFVAILLTVLLLETTINTALIAPTVAAAPLPYQDPLGLLPQWALEGGISQDPVANLLPKNPLDGLLPNVTGPAAPGSPQSAGQGAGQPTLKAPADVNIPTPPAGPDCDCTPDHFNVGTGALSLSATDLTLNGVGQPLQLTRRYSSADAEKDGPFGPGWSFNLESRLEIYLHWDITEYCRDAGMTTFRFQDGSGGAFVDSFDGDNLIHTDLSKVVRPFTRTAPGTSGPTSWTRSSGSPGWPIPLATPRLQPTTTRAASTRSRHPTGSFQPTATTTPVGC